MFRKPSSLVCLLIFIKNFFFILSVKIHREFLCVCQLASPEVSILCDPGAVVTAERLTVCTVVRLLAVGWGVGWIALRFWYNQKMG